MSGTSLLRDGQTTSEQYGVDLDQLGEGDRVGVMRTLQGELHFFVNGEDQGSVPYSRIPTPIWAVVDLYGKCVQVTITDTTTYQSNRQNGEHLCYRILGYNGKVE